MDKINKHSISFLLNDPQPSAPASRLNELGGSSQSGPVGESSTELGLRRRPTSPPVELQRGSKRPKTAHLPSSSSQIPSEANPVQNRVTVPISSSEAHPLKLEDAQLLDLLEGISKKTNDGGLGLEAKRMRQDMLQLALKLDYAIIFKIARPSERSSVQLNDEFRQKVREILSDSARGLSLDSSANESRREVEMAAVLFRATMAVVDEYQKQKDLRRDEASKSKKSVVLVAAELLSELMSPLLPNKEIDRVWVFDVLCGKRHYINNNFVEGLRKIIDDNEKLQPYLALCEYLNSRSVAATKSISYALLLKIFDEKLTGKEALKDRVDNFSHQGASDKCAITAGHYQSACNKMIKAIDEIDLISPGIFETGGASSS